ncbi:PREDICTED: rab effector MyRIP isoform X2 [Gekko japonicus]|uniref:Rab effector MyRIP isoform X2 n=1 Tax=Gekko japonicus TaxID=146911 RepID=A0ABM1KIT9_GEKJA|nr:PREDICTED: rab effector MyRIP isoform X2 [Gekko japonicus]
MGRKLDLSGLTDDEAEHVLQVVQRDFNLRKKEEDRLSEMKQKLDEEGNKCNILSKQHSFNERCCMRCCTPFTFLINTKRQCQDCKYNICKNCSSYQKKEKAWLCNVCQQVKLLRAQSLEWYYNNVKSRFKRFGSAKVLKNLYRKHRLESGACSEILAGSFCEGTIENEGSICGSDSTFYRQTEGHSMMDTLSVALRVAEEAIEEAISKTETYSDSLEKQNEATYLREHKEELIEELATTIVQKIIRKQKSKTEQPETGFEWPQSRSRGWTALSDQSMLTFPGSRRGSYSLWRSQSAFSLTNEDASGRDPDLTSSVAESLWRQPKGSIRKQKEHSVSALPSWKSVDQLNEPTPPPVLQSTDGNWVALQNVTLPRPRMIAKPKSQVFRVLESESSVVSVYDEMGSDSEDDYDWNVALNKLRRRPKQLSKELHYVDPHCNLEWAYGNDLHQPVTSPSSGLFTNTETMCSDSETSSVGSSRDAGGSSHLPWIQRRTRHNKPREEKAQLHGELDVNFNPQATSLDYSDSSESEDAYYDLEKRSRRWKKGKAVSEDLCKGKNRSKTHKKNLSTSQASDDLSETDISSEDQHHQPKAESMEEKLKSRLFELVAKMSDNKESSSEEQGLEPRTESETQKSCLSSEESGRSIQEELKKVYLTAGGVYGLESQLNELEDAARRINSVTAESELADLEDQVATAAAQVHQSELQISDIESRISALTVAGLNVAPCVHLLRKRDQKQTNQMHTIDTSRQQRRKLPAPPVKGENIDASPVTPDRTCNKNFMLQGSLTQRTKERKSTAKDLMEPSIGSAVMY